MRQQLEKAEADGDTLHRRVQELMAAQEPVASRQAAMERIGQMETRFKTINAEKDALVALINEYRRTADDLSRSRAAQLYPRDFRERCATLKALWAERDQPTNSSDGARVNDPASTRPPAVVAIAAGLAFALAVVAVAMGQTAPGVALFVVAAFLGGLWWARKRGLQRAQEEVQRATEGAANRRSALEKRISAALNGLPGADSLTSATVGQAIAAFDEQQRLEAAHATAERRLVERVEHLRITLLAVGAGELRQNVSVDEQASAAHEQLGIAYTDVVQSLAKERVALKKDLALHGDLPGGVMPTVQSITTALDAALREQRSLQEKTQTIRDQLNEQGRAGESSVALADRLAEVSGRRAKIVQRLAVLRGASTLLDAAYSRFRDRDQSRLLASISARALAISDGTIGPFETDGSLEDATIRAYGRSVAIACPPMSFGERHCAGLAIRLGSADFLAGIDIVLPLLIDDPFAHLDAEHAAAVWRTLAKIAEERQVIVTTHESALLAQLGVEPQIRLEAGTLTAS